MESVESVESLGSPDSLGSAGSAGSVGPRCALKITALRAKIGSVVPTALIFIFALRAKMSLCMESVESVCLEVGWALRLKLNENFNENCIDAGLLHTNYRELTANYHLIISLPRGWRGAALKIY